MDPDRSWLVLASSVVGLGVVVVGALFLFGPASWGRGAGVGFLISLVYLSMLRRHVRAFVHGQLGRSVSRLDRLILRTGMVGRYGVVGVGFAAVARSHPEVDLRSSILAFFSFRLVLGVHEVVVALKARRAPRPPALEREEGDERFLSRERWSFGRRKGWREGR
ncbi:MAG: hypothetical protein VKO21_08145 [Candidatus Sericytochromatia bacterium]|nr:hypothetical protein [Candidatus Sericytochromatia bacterium]